MHYTANGCTIESELAAKSTTQPNSYVLDFIKKLSPNNTVLDYGCGKLRYAIPLSKQVSEVVAIDSIFQVDKQQLIFGKLCAPRKFKADKLFVQSINDHEWKERLYDVVFLYKCFISYPLRLGKVGSPP